MTALAPLSAALPSTPAQRLNTARDFEAVFLGQVTKLMFESVELDPQFSGGEGEAMFRGVMAEELGTMIAACGGLGIAAAVAAQIERIEGGGQ